MSSDSHNLFYWFFRHPNPEAPLVLWLNGGPGATSMFGLFLENGPLRVERTGPGEDQFVLKPAEKSWADDYNLIFLDQPVGTGFSFGNSTLTEMEDGSKEFLGFMLEFYEMYPELKDNRFFMTGESYAGKYLPLFTHEILEYNRYQSAETKIPLEFSYIIDPYPSPAIQRTHMHLVGQGLDILDDTNLYQLAAIEQQCHFDHAHNISRARDTCGSIMDYIMDVSGGVMEYNSRIFNYDWEKIEDPY
jgi:hypothetical protein